MSVNKSYSDKELLRFAKRGVLVKKMKKSDDFLSGSSAKEQLKMYKMCIGTVVKYSFKKKK